MAKINIFKEKKGIIVADAIVAILIILLFAGIVTSITINIFSEKTKIKLNSMYLDVVTEILEYVQQADFKDVTEANLINYVNAKDSEYFSAGSSLENLTTPYKIQINVESYIPESSEMQLELIKVIHIKMQKTVGDKTYEKSVSKLKKANENDLIEIFENGSL